MFLPSSQLKVEDGKGHSNIGEACQDGASVNKDVDGADDEGHGKGDVELTDVEVADVNLVDVDVVHVEG
ncbi:hypothetical protein VNO77_33688 [Canavalia gladiata]|uniref:Uncharacterized protein n=1 Tax=Canavalia gladiata TaxID=3824 RepID=A0AAN9PWL6_CANGL